MRRGPENWERAPLTRWYVVRKLDLSQSCFSLNLYFLMFLRLFPSMFPLLTYSQSFFSLSADHPRHSRRRRNKISILLILETSLKIILRLRNLSRFPNRLVDPLVDLHQSLHLNSASTTSISLSISTTGASSILSTPTAPKRASPSSSERPTVRCIANPETKL